MSYHHTHKISIIIALGAIALLLASLFSSPTPNLPKIAIANYGPHASLQETIQGIKDQLEYLGFKEGHQIVFEITDVNFESTLIPQMLSKLKASNPKVVVAMTTPVAQGAKTSIRNIPIIFSDITDPVEAGLLATANQPEVNLTGASDRQDLNLFIKFAKQLLPNANRIGLLYATGEANDLALVKMMQKAAKANNFEVVSIPVEHARDIPMRMQAFKYKVDLIYVGVSGPIQPSLPTIVSEADRMKIPVFNADSDAVKKHYVLGSFGVSYYQVGVNTANIIVQILNGEKVNSINPVYPSSSDHHGFISQKKAKQLGLTLPTSLQNITIVE